MKIIKNPFANHEYLMSYKDLNDLIEFEDWMCNDSRSNKWVSVGLNMIRIVDRSFESMFILKWLS